MMSRFMLIAVENWYHHMDKLASTDIHFEETKIEVKQLKINGQVLVLSITIINGQWMP